MDYKIPFWVLLAVVLIVSASLFVFFVVWNIRRNKKQQVAADGSNIDEQPAENEPNIVEEVKQNQQPQQPVVGDANIVQVGAGENIDEEVQQNPQPQPPVVGDANLVQVGAAENIGAEEKKQEPRAEPPVGDEKQSGLVTGQSAVPYRDGFCGICEGPLNDPKNIGTLICKHEFHKTCLDVTVFDTSKNKKEKRCPVCNKKLPPACSICLEDIILEVTPGWTDCWHLFHRKCLDMWLQERKICPQCNNKVKDVQDYAVSDKIVYRSAAAGTRWEGIPPDDPLEY